MDGYLETEAPEAEYGDYFDSDYEYYTRRIQAFCDCCSQADFGTAAELEKRGWRLGQREQFCWMHR